MKQYVMVAVVGCSLLSGCTAVKGVFGSPVKNAAAEQICKDGQKSLAEIDAQLRQMVTDPDGLAWLKKRHDFVQLALKQCEETMKNS